MILDYNFSSRQKRLDISYIEDNGQKQVLSFNVSRFKTYYYTPSGKYDNWDGAKCNVRWTEKPSNFDLFEYMAELDPKYKALLAKKTFPKLYTFDIETRLQKEGPRPDLADEPITTISICSSDLNTIVLGTQPISEVDHQWIKDQYAEYLANTKFFHQLGMKPGYVKYICFKTEEEMLKYFLQNIVAKVPILAGWNCKQFDWQYIQNRVKNYYPDVPIRSSSCKFSTRLERCTTKYGVEYDLNTPYHTLIVDMQQVIEDNDKVVLPIKESMSLDWIAHESMGINKIDYTGDLDDLYFKDYRRYVFYNSIDSLLVQLINYKFKTLNSFYLFSNYTNERIGKCFSKIAMTEALVFKDFYAHNIKIVGSENTHSERGKLSGAYVKIPITGIHSFVACNDFASLYPSTIRTCNLSFENYICNYRDEAKLDEFRKQPDKYIVIGSTVYKNVGSVTHPKKAHSIGTFLLEDKLEPFRKDPNYFVSVEGSVYKNDKDYAFRRIQGEMKAHRDLNKYLGKRLDAKVMKAIEEIQKGREFEEAVWDEQMLASVKDMGYNMSCNNDLLKLSKEELDEFKTKLSSTITYCSMVEQATKILMNSMYGGSSKVEFFFFNIDLANDITAESRNLTHLMEGHIPAYFRDHWLEMTNLHKQLGIEIDPVAAKQALEDSPVVDPNVDPDAFRGHSYVYPAYGDTDSIYLSYTFLLHTIKNFNKLTQEQKRDIIVQINALFLNQHNREFIKDYYDERHAQSVHDFELETVSLSGCWLDVKKRYAQLLMWKDGKCFDIDDLPLKIKGLEMIKSTVPAIARKQLKHLTRFLLENAEDKYLIQKLNIEMMKCRDEFLNASVEDCCCNMNVNAYGKYIVSDNDPSGLKVAPKCPPNVVALGYYNWFRNVKGCPGEPIRGGKLKWYWSLVPGSKDYKPFAFQSMLYPKWADEYAPISKMKMFEICVIDPFNRMITSNGMPPLSANGYIQTSLF